MIIRPMQQEDMSSCRYIIAESWSKLTAQLAEPELIEMFNGGAWRPFYYVMDDNGKPVSMAGYGSSWLTYGVYNLFWVATLPQYRKRGIASKLVEACLDDLRPVADAVMLVTGIPNFYERWGFQTIARVPTAEHFGDYLMLSFVKGVVGS